jgi:hypothetical protein
MAQQVMSLFGRLVSSKTKRRPKDRKIQVENIQKKNVIENFLMG